jgi:hypothetical protein
VTGYATRPGAVVGIDGIAFQCDSVGPVQALLTRPLEAARLRLDGRRIGNGNGRPHVPLANRVGVVVQVLQPDGDVRPYVVEQVSESRHTTACADGLSWISYVRFQERDFGGWDVMVPASAFAMIQPGDAGAAIERLNASVECTLLTETDTGLVERVFGREMFGDPWILDRFASGDGYHVSASAVPLLGGEIRLGARARWLLRADALPATVAALDRAGHAEVDAEPAQARFLERQAASYLHTTSATVCAAIAWLLLRLERRLRRRPASLYG